MQHGHMLVLYCIQEVKNMPEIFEKIDRLKPVYDGVYNFVMFLCKMLLLVDIGITTYSILGRFIPFIEDPVWSEEIVLTLMCYMAVLSAALAIRRNAHIRMTVFDKYLPINVVRVLDIISDIAVLILAIVMVVVGLSYANGIGGKGFYISMPWLSRFWMYFPVPLAGIAMIIFELEALYNHVKVFWTHEDQLTGAEALLEEATKGSE